MSFAPFLRRVAPALLLGVLALVAPAAADPIVWTNAAGGSWNDAANWNSGAGPVPGALDTALVTTPGTYTVTLDTDAGVASLTVGGGAGLQTLSVLNRTLTLDGPSTVTGTGVLTIEGATIAGAGTLENQGLLIARATSAINVALTTDPGSTLRCEGTVSGTGALTVANGFTNDGTIELTNKVSGQSASLTVTDGTLVNDAGHTISVLAGAGGGIRSLNAQLDNHGLLALSVPLTINRASSVHVNESDGTIDLGAANLALLQSGTTPGFTNAGTITIGAGRTLAITGGAYTHGGTITGGGLLSLGSVTAALSSDLTNADVDLVISNSIVGGPGTLVNVATKSLVLTSTVVNAAATNQGVLAARSACALNGPLTAATGSTLRCLGSSFGDAMLTVANGFTNDGTIELTNDNAGRGATLVVTTGTLMNSPGQSIAILAGAGGGARTLDLVLENHGTLSIGQSLTMHRPSTAHVNAIDGTIDLVGGDLTLIQSGASPSFTNLGLLAVGDGHTLGISGGTFNFGGGLIGTGTLSLSNLIAALTTDLTNADVALAITGSTLNGPAQLINAAGRTMLLVSTAVSAPMSNQGVLVTHAICALNGPVTTGAASTSRVEGSSAGTATLAIASGFTNNGTIELTSILGGQGATLSVTSGALVNAPGARINVLPGAGGGARTLNVALDNHGSLNVLRALTMGRASSAHVNESDGAINVSGGDLTVNQSGTVPSFVNNGTITIGPTRTMSLTTGDFTQNGSFAGSGKLVLNNLAATLATDLATPTGGLDVSNSVVNGPGQFVNAAARTLTLTQTTVHAGAVNQGTIVGHGTWTQNGSLTSAPGSTVRIEGGYPNAATATVANGFTNDGAIELVPGPLGQAAKLVVSAGTMTNAGTIRGAGTLDVSAATFANAGHVSPGSSPGLLTILGADPESPEAALDIELGGLAAGTQFDRLAVSGAMTLAGALNVSLVNGYVPAPGDRFRVVTAGALSGLFGSTTGLDLGGGLSLEPLYDTTGVTLVVVAQTWVRLTPESALPPARDGHSAVYDPGSNRMIVFGGRGDAGALADTRVLVNANGQGGAPAWSALAPTGGPPTARVNHSAVYDPGSGRMIVYGGDDGSGGLFGDLWVLTNANGLGGTPAWTSLAPLGGPPPARTQHSAVYDAANNLMIVFGGNPTAGACASGLNDAWVLSNANGLGGTPEWTQLSPASGLPLARRAHVASYDAANNRLLVVGGDLNCVSSSNEAWLLDHANGLGGVPAWSLLPIGGAIPSPWSQRSGVYDPALNRITLFGGLVSGVPTNSSVDLAHANGTGGSAAWVDDSPTPYRPAARSLHSAVLDAATHRMIVFGGNDGTSRLNDTWVLELTGGRVVDVGPSPGGPPAATITGFSRPIAPNPTTGSAHFAISLARAQRVDVSIYDIAGRRVTTLARGVLEAGVHPFEWDGTLADGRRAAAGIYLVNFRGEDANETRRVCVVR